MPNEANVLQAS